MKNRNVDDPLEQAIRFLQPLQTLAKDRIETHLMAFELYYRKKRVLLMLQSLKRAHQVDPKHPKVHSCLIRFSQFINEIRSSWDPRVEEVVLKESKLFFNGKDAHKLNKEFLENNSDSLRAVLEGAKMMYHLDNKSQSQAIELVTSLDNKYQDVNIQVCTEILNSLRKGNFGSCDAQLEEFVKKCNSRFPYTAAFKPPSEIVPPSESNHVSPDQDGYNSN
nr:N-alpha-acetyltransferase 16, NatA auxiliary subunit-like [Leptinotarsa decemlineata]